MNYTVEKLVIELRFSGVVDLSNNMDKLNRLKEKLGNNFPDANYDFGSNTFLLQNAWEKKQCVVQPNRVLIVHDREEDIEEAVSGCDFIMKAIESQQLFDDTIIRKGVRIYYLDKQLDSDVIDNSIKENFFNMKKIDLLGKDLKNVGIHFVEKREDYMINYNISSAVNGEVSIDPMNGNVISNKSVPVLVIDLDFHNDKENQNISEVGSFLREAADESKKIADKLKEVMD